MGVFLIECFHKEKENFFLNMIKNLAILDYIMRKATFFSKKITKTKKSIKIASKTEFPKMNHIRRVRWNYSTF